MHVCIYVYIHECMYVCTSDLQQVANDTGDDLASKCIIPLHVLADTGHVFRGKGRALT